MAPTGGHPARGAVAQLVVLLHSLLSITAATLTSQTGDSTWASASSWSPTTVPCVADAVALAPSSNVTVTGRARAMLLQFTGGAAQIVLVNGATLEFPYQGMPAPYWCSVSTPYPVTPPVVVPPSLPGAGSVGVSAMYGLATAPVSVSAMLASSFMDKNGEPLVYVMAFVSSSSPNVTATTAEWLTFNGSNGTVGGLPATPALALTTSVYAFAASNSLYTTHAPTSSVNVTAVVDKRPPVLTAQATIAASQSPWTFVVSVSVIPSQWPPNAYNLAGVIADPDGFALSYTMLGWPSSYGLQFDTSTLRPYGTPTLAGTWTVVLVGTNTVGQSANFTFGLNIIQTCPSNFVSTGGGTCLDCAPSYYGPNCLPCSVCALHGTCLPTITGNCTCTAGFAGPSCSESTAPTTAAPTTAAPTTSTPTTPTSTTPAPTTPTPTTSAPTTSTPTTPTPTTPTSTTPAPTTHTPTTSAPTTPAPTTSIPTSPEPTTSAATTPVPSTAAPTSSTPTTSAPTTPTPSTETPTTPVPTTPAPTTPAPTTGAPSTAAPTTALVPTTQGPTQVATTPMPTNGTGTSDEAANAGASTPVLAGASAGSVVLLLLVILGLLFWKRRSHTSSAAKRGGSGTPNDADFMEMQHGASVESMKGRTPSRPSSSDALTGVTTSNDSGYLTPAKSDRPTGTTSNSTATTSGGSASIVVHSEHAYAPSTTSTLVGADAMQDIEIPFSAVDVDASWPPLGQGAFGTVFLGKWRGIDVAVKHIPGNILTPAERNSILNEVRIMARLRHHDNVVQLSGVCLDRLPDLYLIVEYCPLGSLEHALHDKKMRKPLQQLPVRRQLARDIAAGLVYLHSKEILHGDLAARNILLRHHNNRMMACVADFGLASQLQQGINTMAVDRQVPVRWSAPEALRAYAAQTTSVFKRASDVWSYGVVLYELYSLGALPYAELEANKDIIAFVVEKRGVLPQPKDCPSQDYSIMKRCWTYNPEQRPPMSEVLGLFDIMAAK